MIQEHLKKIAPQFFLYPKAILLILSYHRASKMISASHPESILELRDWK